MRADRGVLGAAVTMPHAVAASRLLDGLGPDAQAIGAVNTISHRAGALIGWNTERSAFAQALDDAGFQAKLIVNATPVGSDGQSVLFPIDWITPAQFVFDLIYQPPVTPLLLGAREQGARAINGLTMLLFQGLAAFEIWTGEAPPEAAMRAALERAVVGRLSS